MKSVPTRMWTHTASSKSSGSSGATADLEQTLGAPVLTATGTRGRTFPSNLTQWNAGALSIIKPPTNIWTMQQAGVPLTDSVNGQDFTTQIAGTVNYQWDGAEPNGRRSVRFATNTAAIRTGTSSDYNMGAAGSGIRMSLWFRFKIPTPLGSIRTFYANMNGSIGHRLSILGDGSLRFDCQDGADEVYVTIGLNHADNVWHDVLVTCNRGLELSTCKSDLGDGGTGDLAAGGVGSMQNMNYLRIGGATTATPINEEVAYVAGWYGLDDTYIITAAEFDHILAN